MRKRAIGLLAVVAAALTACASNAELTAINGGYYLAGDSSCVRYRMLSPMRIMCINTDGQESGYRDAMSPQQLQVYLYNRQVQAQEMQQLTQSVQQLGNSFQPYPQYQQYQYVAPQVMPIAPPGRNQMRCVSTGFYTNCR